MSRPLTVLDLGCGVGGVSFGYHLAGCLVTGVDIAPQPSYPFPGRFIQADYLDFPLEGYDLIHLSAPCQRFSRMVKSRPGLWQRYPDHITPMRPRLIASGIPYVIENVEGAPLREPILLCGASFGREMYRHRLIETSLDIAPPPHPRHAVRASRAGHWEPGTYISVAGHCSPMWKAREAMGISWGTREELAEAVPPCFSEYIGLQARLALMVAA